MGLLDLTKNLTYNNEFETNPIENQTGPEVSSDFQTSNLESSPVEEIGSVNFFQNPHGADENGVGGFNISGFTQFMPKLETLYPGEGLNNSGIVDSFPNPHGIGHFGVNDVPHNIEGFVADVQPLSDGFYPNTIELGSVDFFPGGNFSNNFLTSTGFTQNVEPFGGNKLETEFKMIGEGNTLNQEFMSNPLFSSINTFGTYKGAVDFIHDDDATGFTKNMYVDGASKLPSQYNMFTNGTIGVIPSPGLSQYSAGLESQYTSIAEGVNGDVDWNLQIGAAGLGDTLPPYSLDQLKTSLPSMNIETSGYLGEVNFFPGGNFSNNFTTSTGFTKNAEAFGEDKITTEFLMIDEDTISQTFLNNEMFRSIKIDGTYKGAVNFISDSVSYATGFTKNMYVDEASKLPSQYNIEQFYTDESLSFSVTSGIPNPSVTTYGISDSIFVGEVGGLENQFSVYTLGDFQPGNVAGMPPRTTINPEGISETRVPFTFDELKIDMSSWNVDGFTYDQFTSKVGTNSFGKTTNTDYLNYDSFLGIPTGPDGDDVGSNLIHFKNGAFGSGFNDSSTAFSYKNIPSLKSVPKPTYNAISGPFSADSGFSSGDFKLGLSSDGTMQTYLQSGLNEENTAVEGSIVTDVTLGLVRSGVSTLGTKLENGDTIFRDIKNMGGMAQTPYSNAYGDGINNGWMKGLIDTSIEDKRDYSGHSADFFIRESGNMRFLDRIGKDLKRNAQFLASTPGIMGLGKDVVMTLFNPSEKSIYSNLLTRFTAGSLGQFGIRGSSIASNVLGLIRNSVAGVPDDNMALYERRVDSKHPSQPGGAGFLRNLISAPEVKERTLTTRYGQPKYPVHKALSKAVVAHKLYAGGMLDPDGTRAKNSFDKINIVSYGQGPDGVDKHKDLIKFNIKDVRNGNYIVLRAFLTNIQDSISPEWNNYRYVGRPDDVYVYKGTTRSVSFSLKVAAFSRREMIPMWEKINYLVGLNYGSFVDTNIYESGEYYQGNPGMSSPICELTIGDYLTSQPGYIKDFNISVPPDYPWDVIIDDGGSNVIGELPQMVDINMGFQVIPQQIPDSYGKHFGKVGLPTDEVSSAGLPWLKDLYDSSKSAIASFNTAHKSYMKNKDIKMNGGESSSDSDVINTEEQQKDATSAASNAAS